MRILGIDPGTIVMGYGIIESDGDDVKVVDFGAISVNERSPIGERLHTLHLRLLEIIDIYQPENVAIEQPFVARNVKSAFAIGRAQAVAILAAAASGLPTSEYTPAQVKQHVAGYGNSSKEQVQEMVRLQLNLSSVPEPNDAADVLAVAICHVQEMHLSGLLLPGGSR